MADAQILPVPDMTHPLMGALLLRTLRLNCLTRAYADFWEALHNDRWFAESWAVGWPFMSPLGAADAAWSASIPLRTEFARRAAMVELDAIVAVMLNIGVEELVQLYRARFPQMVTYEGEMWFDAAERRVAENFNAYGQRQKKGDYERLQEHLGAPESVTSPVGYVKPFYKADREAEYREAHAVFSERLERAKTEGWTPGGGVSSSA